MKLRSKETMDGSSMIGDRYIVPHISKDDLQYRPIVVHEKFMDDFYQMARMWLEKYDDHFNRYTACSVLETIIAKLELEMHIDRKMKSQKK